MPHILDPSGKCLIRWVGPSLPPSAPELSLRMKTASLKAEAVKQKQADNSEP